MDKLEAVLGVLGCSVLALLFVYTAARLVSVAWFRSQREYNE